VPRILIVVNKMPPRFDTAAVKKRVEEAYGCEVAAVVPHSDDMMEMGSGGIFALKFPDHPIAAQYKQLIARIG
jgi:hypothetical protein